MDRNDKYRAIVKQILQEVASMTPSTEDVRTELVCDDTLGHYQIGEVGWEDGRRIDNVYIHIDICAGKVWLQHDGTNLKIAEDLVRAGIPKEHIVLAFHRPDLRQYDEYAIA